MKTQCKSLLIIAMSVLSLSADTLTQINFEQDSEGNLNPNIFIPIFWNENIYSGVGYTSSTTKSIDKIVGFDDSKNGAVSSKNDLLLNYLTYQQKYFSIGLSSNIIKIKNNEFGYIHDSANIFENGSDYWISFDNDVELNILTTQAYLDHHLSLGDLFYRLSTTITPLTRIGVKQETLFKPLVHEVGSSSSSTQQELAYKVKFEAYYDTHFFVKLGAECSYESMPLKYNIAQLAYVDNSYIFQSATIDVVESTTRYLLKLYFDKKMLGGLLPSIGLGKVSLKSYDNNSKESTSTEENIVSLGFEKRF